MSPRVTGGSQRSKCFPSSVLQLLWYTKGKEVTINSEVSVSRSIESSFIKKFQTCLNKMTEHFSTLQACVSALSEPQNLHYIFRISENIAVTDFDIKA